MITSNKIDGRDVSIEWSITDSIPGGYQTCHVVGDGDDGGVYFAQGTALNGDLIEVKNNTIELVSTWL